MSVKLEWNGLEELIQQLTHAPEAIRQEGLVIVQDDVTNAATEIALRYPSRTGTLARRVRTYFPSSQVLFGGIRSAAPHAHLYEFGTRKRQTGKGWNRGTMPAASPPVFVPIVQRHRLRMYDRLADMLRRMGWEVVGG
jgi:hypothetical protein